MNERILNVRLKFNRGCYLTIIGTYAPGKDKESESERHYDELQRNLQNK